ncbi:MAG: NADH-quinone oxidoreductase subunit J [Bacteroidales bacterium]|nr:NADH-quinone oxidoreductase subunit J [Bacteroidales bacterium]
MSLYEVMFAIFSAVILVFSVLTITSRRILRAAVYLLFVLISTAGIYFWLQYEFLAGVQVALYAGGIVVLIIFSILLTHHIEHKFDKPGLWNVIAGFGIAALGSFIAISTIINHDFIPSNKEAIDSSVKNIGRQLVSTGHDGYVLPFEVISILLLAALIGAIVVARKETDKSETTSK